jgi:NTE family protein
LIVTAVDASTGEFVTFDRHSGVDLIDAVAASCAVPGVWPPVTIGSSRYIDGGVRSVVNLDLAADCDLVVVLAPSVMGFGGSVLDQAAELRQTGVTVEVIAADDASLAAFGPNVLDPATREPSLIEGRRQGAEVVEHLRLVWA